MNFLFSFLLFFFHVFFIFLGVLSVPISRNTDILSHFPSINYQTLAHMGLNDCCNLQTKLLFQTSVKLQNCTCQVPLLFLALFLALESHCGASGRSTYRISNVIKLAWLKSPYWCDTVILVVDVGDSMRPRVILLAMLTMKKQTQGFHNFYTWFSSVSPISIRTGLRFPSTLGQRSSAIMG